MDRPKNDTIFPSHFATQKNEKKAAKGGLYP